MDKSKSTPGQRKLVRLTPEQARRRGLKANSITGEPITHHRPTGRTGGRSACIARVAESSGNAAQARSPAAGRQRPSDANGVRLGITGSAARGAVERQPAATLTKGNLTLNLR